MKRFKSIVLAAVATVIAASYVMPANVSAAISSSSLSIAPKKTYLVEAGKSVKDKLLIRNLDTAHPLDLSLRVVDFTFTDDGGTPKLFLADDAPQTTWSLKPYLTVPQNVTIPKGGSKSLDMSVAIPAGHGAGSYYSAIVYSSGAGVGGNAGGNVGLSASGVTLVFTNIPGKVNEDLTLKQLGGYNPAKPGNKAHFTSFITAEKPWNIAYTLQNKGNVTEAPVGSITLQYMFGKPQTITEINPAGSLALIGQTRTFTSCINLKQQDVNLDGASSRAPTCVEPSLWPGLYTVSIDGYYGQNGNTTQEIKGTATFWYIPTWFLVLLLIVLAVIAYYVWKVVRFFRGGKSGTSHRKIRRRK